MRILAGVSLLLALAAGGLAVYLLDTCVRLRQRVAELEGRDAVAPAPQPAPELMRKITREVLEELDRRASPSESRSGPGAAPPPELSADLEQLTLRLDAAEQRLEEAAGSLRTARAELLAGRLPSGETVDEFLDRRLAEHLMGGARDRPGAAGGSDRNSFDALARALALDEVQREEVQGILDESKRQAYELLLTPRLDGGNFMDDFAAAFAGGSEDPERTAEQIFMRALGEPIPGRTETYGAALIALQSKAGDSIRERLREDQVAVFNGLGVDLLEVETEFDPMREHVMRRLGVSPPGEEGR